MNLKIKVVTKGNANTKPAANVCPWVVDVPPETGR